MNSINQLLSQKFHSYSDSKLPELLNTYKFNSISEIKLVFPYDYFKEYLGNNGLQANYSLVEENYVSVDFLRDFQQYYASCFTRPDQKLIKSCSRIHFFKIDTKEDEARIEVEKAYLEQRSKKLERHTKKELTGILQTQELLCHFCF